MPEIFGLSALVDTFMLGLTLFSDIGINFSIAVLIATLVLGFTSRKIFGPRDLLVGVRIIDIKHALRAAAILEEDRARPARSVREDYWISPASLAMPVMRSTRFFMSASISSPDRSSGRRPLSLTRAAHSSVL